MKRATGEREGGNVGVLGSKVWQVANYSDVCLFTTTALEPLAAASPTVQE